MYLFVIGFVLGALIGAGIALAAGVVRFRGTERAMREAFAAMSAEALDANSRRLLESAASQLEGKKQLIDQAVRATAERLEQVRQLLQGIESERKQDLGRLSTSVSSLSTTTGELHRMLASTQRRGAWGERMAEDILRLAGLQEGVNYSKQDAAQVEQGRPDFTFFLPNDLKANMDVKFPLERYKAYADADTDEARRAELGELVKAVRGHVEAVARRGYIDPKVPTVPYVIVFIPSEQIFGLVLQARADLVDEALARRVVLASPLTLYAMLAVIRQAAENANVMRTANEVVSVLAEFHKQWQNYNAEVDKLGERLGAALRQYEVVRTTRTNMLQRPLDRIEQLRQSRSLPSGGADRPNGQ